MAPKSLTSLLFLSFISLAVAFNVGVISQSPSNVYTGQQYTTIYNVYSNISREFSADVDTNGTTGANVSMNGVACGSNNDKFICTGQLNVGSNFPNIAITFPKAANVSVIVQFSYAEAIQPQLATKQNTTKNNTTININQTKKSTPKQSNINNIKPANTPPTSNISKSTNSSQTKQVIKTSIAFSDSFLLAIGIASFFIIAALAYLIFAA